MNFCWNRVRRRVSMMVAAVAIVIPLSVSAAAPPAHASGVYHLTDVKLLATDLEDEWWDTADEVSVLYDYTKVAWLSPMRAWAPRDLPSKSLDRDLTVDLVEWDGYNARHLGSQTIDVDLLGPQQSKRFSQRGYNYTLYYTLSRAT